MTSAQTRWAILVEYEGTDFVGWQHQANGPSVQEALEHALERLTGVPVRVLGSGRTDTGVHALGQVAAFSTGLSLKEFNVVRGGNAFLPSSVRIRSARKVPPAFNPRRDALRRHYRYRLAQGGAPPALERTTLAWLSNEVDWERAREALALMKGVHEFAAFRSSRCSALRTRLNLERADLILTPRGNDPGLGTLAEFHFECRSFLHNMVRQLVGAAVEAGRGRLAPDTLADLLETGVRGLARFRTAAPEGLCLISVQYPPELGLWAE